MARKRKIGRNGFRAKDAPAPTMARNLDQEKGEPIQVKDIAPYGKPGHLRCAAKGWFLRKDGVAEACKCATKRFFKAHPEVIIGADGRGAWWPAAAKAPEAAEAGLGES